MAYECIRVTDEYILVNIHEGSFLFIFDLFIAFFCFFFFFNRHQVLVVF